MRIEVDVSEAHRAARAARRAFAKLPGRMLRVGQFAAKYERDSHEYQNRTGMLEASTVASIQEGPGETVLELTMDMPYASYVVNRGFSNIDEAARLVIRELTAGFNAMAKEIG